MRTKNYTVTLYLGGQYAIARVNAETPLVAMDIARNQCGETPVYNASCYHRNVYYQAIFACPVE